MTSYVSHGVSKIEADEGITEWHSERKNFTNMISL